MEAYYFAKLRMYGYFYMYIFARITKPQTYLLNYVQKNKSNRPGGPGLCSWITKQRNNYYFIRTSAIVTSCRTKRSSHLGYNTYIVFWLKNTALEDLDSSSDFVLEYVQKSFPSMTNKVALLHCINYDMKN